MDSTPARLATFFPGDLTMKYFPWSFSLPLIQEGQLSISGERMCTMLTSIKLILVNRLED